jgi:hypothetical protein
VKLSLFLGFVCHGFVGFFRVLYHDPQKRKNPQNVTKKREITGQLHPKQASNRLKTGFIRMFVFKLHARNRPKPAKRAAARVKVGELIF